MDNYNRIVYELCNYFLTMEENEEYLFSCLCDIIFYPFEVLYTTQFELMYSRSHHVMSEHLKQAIIQFECRGQCLRQHADNVYDIYEAHFDEIINREENLDAISFDVMRSIPLVMELAARYDECEIDDLCESEERRAKATPLPLVSFCKP